MTKTKPFNHLLQKMTPRRAKIETQVQLALLHLALVERQKSLGYANENIDFSELENLDDISVSSLSQYIKAQAWKFKASS